MKFFQPHRIFIIILLHVLPLPLALAQGNRDYMRETGKINVVVAVILVIFIGVAGYLVRLDRKLTKIEHQTKDDHEWTN